MLGRILFTAVLCVVASGEAIAARFTADISDQDGRPAPNAVVMLVPEIKTDMPTALSRLTPEKTVDQRKETFLPLVSIVPRGGHLIFTNNDQTKHQVYSFSSIKSFEFTLAHGTVSPPVVFERSGVAAIGCNIHDHMIAYAFVSDSPWTALTDAQGHLQIADVPAGDYTAQIWHPRLSVGAVTSARVTIGATDAQLKTKITLLGAPAEHRMHGGDY